MPENREHSPAVEARELSSLQAHDARWRSDLLIDVRAEVSDPSDEAQWFSAFCRPTLLRRVAAEIGSRLPHDTTFLQVGGRAADLVIGVAVSLHAGLRLVSETTGDAPRGSGEHAAVIGLFAPEGSDPDGISVVGSTQALFTAAEISGREYVVREAHE
ncbi:MAG: hypothetical protein ACTH93_09415 [Pseudoclavibacter sp.]